MARANIFLAVMIVACALGVVAAQHKARKLYSELEREQEHMRQLEVEWGQLQLEQSTWAAHSRIEKLAREKLQMTAPVPGGVLSLDQKGGRP